MPKTNATNIGPITAQQFINDIKDYKQSNDNRFCFVLGAGASVTSGIMPGSYYAKKWLEEIKNDIKGVEAPEVDAEIMAIKPDKIAENYTSIYKERFRRNPQLGFDFLNREMEGKSPSAGYAFLAQILAETHHNIVVTTNFDSLTELALYRYTEKQPLICGHESLAAFAKASLNRPLIAKVHGSMFLPMANETETTAAQAKAWQGALNSLLHDKILVVVGYGGNDGSLMGVLEKIDTIQKVYWCELQDAKPNHSVLTLLKQKKGHWVQISGFDNLMYDMAEALDMPLRSLEITEMYQNWHQKYDDAFSALQQQNETSNIEEGKYRAEKMKSFFSKK